MNSKRVLLSLLFAALTLLTWSQATPPSLINYQGVLRDSAGAPLSGDHDMTFRFYSASSGGDQILIDTHTAALSAPVMVTGGLFSVALGSGALSDGSGPGTYTNLAVAFRDYGTVWLDIVVGAETLSPRLQIVAAAYALNADNLDGLDSTAFISSTTDNWVNTGGDTMTGKLTTAASASGGAGLTLPHGSAPSSPSNGDLWTTTGGLYSRINGATVGPFTTASSHTHSNLTQGTGIAAFTYNGGSTATIGLANTAVTAGSYGNLGAVGTFTVDAQGRLSAASSATIDHGSVAGLGDDDHTQYFNLSQSENVSGTPAFNGGTSGASPPFTVDSTFVVSNLNVDRLDNLHSSDFMTSTTDNWVNTGGDTMTGKLTTAASGTGNAGLTLPHGSAPSTPSDGDLWTTTGGLFAQINSATVGPFTTASGHTHSTLTAGTGLSGGSYNGGFTATFAVAYGTASGTAVQGNQTGTITAGAGLTGGISGDALGDGFSTTLNVGGGSGITAGADSLALGPLTADWNQTGAFNISLNNASSELQFLESAGATYYGILDVGDLSANATYTFSGASGTVWTTGNDGAGSTLSADLLDGQHGSYYLDTSSTAQTKASTLTLQAGSGLGVDANGPVGGGRFLDTNSSGFAYVAYGDLGISAEGNTAGGYFLDSDSASYAYAGYGNYGIAGYGVTSGGYFKCLDAGGLAETWIGRLFSGGYYGVRAAGDTAGGYFLDSNNSGYSYIGYGDLGIDARGNTAGGYFKDRDHSGYAYAGYGDMGVYGSGSSWGGQFEHSGTGAAWAYAGAAYDPGSGVKYYGIRAGGDTAGGLFSRPGSAESATLAGGGYGIQATGSVGGIFTNSSGFSTVEVADGGTGLNVTAESNGAYFQETTNGNYALIASSLCGISCVATSEGGSFISTGIDGVPGSFHNQDTGNGTDVAYRTYKVNGSGSSAFVQNHPYDSAKVIVYNAPEGDEVATYTRGSARLTNGEARVKLGETFQWVTNPDIGLTVYLTPVGEWADLFVAGKSTTELIVRSRDGSSNASFDYMVHGLRIGFEEVSIVQERRREAWIPAMTMHRNLFVRQPALRAFNALERFKGMRLERGVSDSLDLSRAIALKEAIHEFEPGVDKIANLHAPPVGGAKSASRVIAPTHAATAPNASALRSKGFSSESPVRPQSESVALAAPVTASAERFPICEPVQEGDVLTNAPEHPGAFCLTKVMNDPGVVGIVVAELPGYAPPQTSSEGGLGFEFAPVATGGVVLCKADATLGPIAANDVLVASPTPGHAMKVPRPVEPGTVIGKALEPLASGTGLIKVLVMLR